MRLCDFLCEETVCMDLRATDKDGVVRELLENLVDSGRLPADMLEVALEAISKREKLGSTALGKGLAVPHARLMGLDGIVIAFGHSEEGIPFDALDGEAVHQVFLIIASEQDTDQYVGVMERISRLLRKEDFRRFLYAARDGQEVMELIREMDV